MFISYSSIFIVSRRRAASIAPSRLSALGHSDSPLNARQPRRSSAASWTGLATQGPSIEGDQECYFCYWQRLTKNLKPRTAMRISWQAPCPGRADVPKGSKMD